MILQIKLKSSSQIVVPLHYKVQLQGLFYNAMDEEMRSFLHNQGYKNGPRVFRLFTFSDIQESARRQGEKLFFGNEITVYFSSHDADLCMSIARNMTGNQQRIGNHYFDSVIVGLANPKITDNIIRVQAVSPIVTYETLHHADGRPYYNYFPAEHPSFTVEVRRNLIRKYNTLYPDTPIDLTADATEIGGTFSQTGETSSNNEAPCFELQALGKNRQVIMYYKNYVIKGVQGEFLLRSDPKLLQVALDCGLGSKNSQGFGMLMLKGR